MLLACLLYSEVLLQQRLEHAVLLQPSAMQARSIQELRRSRLCSGKALQNLDICVPAMTVSTEILCQAILEDHQQDDASPQYLNQLVCQLSLAGIAEKSGAFRHSLLFHISVSITSEMVALALQEAAS